MVVDERLKILLEQGEEAGCLNLSAVSEFLQEADLDEDHLQEVSQLLRDMEENGEEEGFDTATRSFHFDLCPDCHQRFVRDPLGKEQVQKLFFSKN